MPTPSTFADLSAPAASRTLVADVKLELLTQLANEGLPALSWETGSVSESLVEIQANAEADYLVNQANVAAIGSNDTATGDALTLLADELFDDQRAEGDFAVGYVRLTDQARTGPYVVDAASLAFTVGINGLRYVGQVAAATGSTAATLPRGGSVDVIVQAESPGSQYNVGTSAISVFAAGRIPGVTVANPRDWQTKYAATTGGQYGTDEEGDGSLQARDRARWALGVGSPVSSYVAWAKAASSVVTRAAVFVNADIFDPGRVDLVVAGAAGPVSGAVVIAVQDYVAPATTGGSLVPETVKCVVASAAAHTVQVVATLYVQATYNTAAFQATVTSNLEGFFEAVDIGGLVSRERIIEVLLYQAGLSAGVITDADVSMPADDVQLGQREVAVLAATVSYVSV